MITNRLFQLSLMMLVLMQSMSAIAQKLPRTLVCYDDIFEPFFMMAGDDFTGINVDLVAEAARRSGIAVTFQKMPFRRLEFELSRGRDSRVDCGFAFSKTAPREKNMLFGQVPIQPTDYTLFVRDESPGITSINDLDGKVIGVRSGFRLPDRLAQGATKNRWRIDDVDNEEVNFKKLLLKRVDAVLTSRDAGMYTLHKLKITGVRTLSPALMHFDTYMVFPVTDSSKALAAGFDQAISDMIADGTYERLRGKYLEQNK